MPTALHVTYRVSLLRTLAAARGTRLQPTHYAPRISALFFIFGRCLSAQRGALRCWLSALVVITTYSTAAITFCAAARRLLPNFAFCETWAGARKRLPIDMKPLLRCDTCA